MKICVITLCYNEEVILPFFIRHYERVADRIIFYDGGSTDRTREIIAACPIAELRVLDTGGRIDDGANVRVKNTAYRDIDADWFIVVDCDEFLSHPDLRGFLAKCDALGLNAVRCEGWNMIGDAIPAGGLLTDQMPCGVRDDYTIKFFDKMALFARSADMRFETGGHAAQVGNGRKAPGLPVKLLHYKWLSLDYVERKSRNLRLSDANIKNGWGFMAPGVPNSETWVDYYKQAHAQRTRVDLQGRESWNSRLDVYLAFAARGLRGAARRLGGKA
jgi:glycosyltransferase involved in cell wall biosynthesis